MPRRKIINNHIGLTLIETLIAIAIAALICVLLASLYSAGQKSYVKAEATAELNQNGRIILERISRELRQSLKIVTNLPADNSQPENLPQEIEFQDGHDQTVITYIRYYLAGTQINRQIRAYAFAANPGVDVYFDATDQNGKFPDVQIIEDRPIGDNVSDLQFWGGRLVNINLVLSKNGQSENLSTAVFGRNL